MSTTLPEPVVRSTPASHADDDMDPMDVSLQDRMPEWFRTPKSFAGFSALVAVTFLLLSYFPIWHTDIWGHLAYGRLIWNTRQLPATEPLMPLSAGVSFIDTAWLSQVVGFGMVKAFGYSAIRMIFAGSIAASLALLIARMFKRTESVGWTLLAAAAWMWLSWQQFLVRPQLFGSLCFTALFCLMMSRRFPRWGWFAIPALMTVWANAHGSFVMGIALLGALCVGRAADVILRSDRFVSVLHDQILRRLVLLTELAIAATLLNPYGMALWAEVVKISGNANLNDLIEWEPLSLRMRQGQAAGAITFLLVVAYRMTPRRISVGEVLLHLGLGGAALWTSRLIVWWAPVAAYSLAMHGNAAYLKWIGGRLRLEPTVRRSLWTVAGIGSLAVALLWSPFGQAVAHPKNRTAMNGMSEQTPVAAVEYLRENPPQGQVFNSYEMGDYLLWAGPPRAKVFLASHAHLVPQEVWRHYFDALNLGVNWDDVLDQYGVNTVLLDSAGRSPLLRALKRDEKWKVSYEDATATVYQRRDPI